MSGDGQSKASDGCYMECLLAIDSAKGWEKSVTKVLKNFQDLSYSIYPNEGLACIKGKIDPHMVLKKLKKGGKHATILKVTYGPQIDDDPANHFYGPRFGHGYVDPHYANYYQHYDPYSWYNHTNYGWLQDANYGQRNNHTNHKNHRGRRRRSPNHPQHRHSPKDNSSPATDPPPVNDQNTSLPPTSRRSIKKVVKNFFLPCMGLCHKF